VFINWNPSLFSHRTVLHQEWPVEQGPAHDTYNLGYNPQYTLVVSYANVSKQAASVIHKTTANTPTVWVLLSRHVTTVETDDSSGDYLTMHLYDVQNEPVSNSRIFYPDVPLARGKVNHTARAVSVYCIVLKVSVLMNDTIYNYSLSLLTLLFTMLCMAFGSLQYRYIFQ
jgi:hypothetical protein